eukprot:CAMPEP_0178846340 /NCGR_PEP_ID=MMETSP0746-20121128/17984_1 /TAXON_ID=913974 /ORGANISM="Nitzschia punctata, Strain CCMP561" /LENGTH=94 /DNA_ID=CAMNT_0020510727 /DNA_START=254 /DNA_END=535 /DNA_ORIENTATION=+
MPICGVGLHHFRKVAKIRGDTAWMEIVCEVTIGGFIESMGVLLRPAVVLHIDGHRLHSHGLPLRKEIGQANFEVQKTGTHVFPQHSRCLRQRQR